MELEWVLTHNGLTHLLPSAAVARFAQRQIERSRLTTDPIYVRFSQPGSTRVTHVLINLSTTITQRRRGT